MLRWLMIILVVAVAAAGGLYFVAGRGAPPALVIHKPGQLVGQQGTLEVEASAPGARLTALEITVEQGGQTTPLFSLGAPGDATVAASGENSLRVSRAFGKRSVPALNAGPAKIFVTATRASFLNLRTLSSQTSKAIEVRLDPPRLSVVSTHHYVNHGGSEMVVYKVLPADVESGVRVGDVEYKGFPAAGAGVTGDPALKVAFFALLHDQELNTPIGLFARDQAGNEAKASFVDNVFPKPFKRSRIELDDRFLNRVVPEIRDHAPELSIDVGEDKLPGFLKINGELRRLNADQIVKVVGATAATRLWSGPFVQLGNSQVEASFADHRTYMYRGKEVDQQVHLGFDLAVTAAVPVVAANAGTVLYADWLGIYGNCVIIDHGMGVASLYGHLSSIGVKSGDQVAKGSVVGRSGMTGLAGGDHLHFTTLVQGRAVNPVEWWDSHWVTDRVERKLREASGSSAATN